MFEDSTFESTGRIRTRSRGWMIAATLFNGSILLALILVPLIYPEALPRQAFQFLVEVPPPSPAPTQPTPQPAHPVSASAQQQQNPYEAPQRIPHFITVPDKPDPPPSSSLQAWDQPPGIPGGIGAPLPGHPAPPEVRLVPRSPVRLSGTVVEGLLINKTPPIYPRIAIEVRSQGTVVLQATISKAGTIENLRVVSGPPMLQQAALDAVKTWRYRPYLLGGEPVEVETTVNVIFTLGR
jgi:protein TonB